MRKLLYLAVAAAVVAVAGTVSVRVDSDTARAQGSGGPAMVALIGSEGGGAMAFNECGDVFFSDLGDWDSKTDATWSYCTTIGIGSTDRVVAVTRFNSNLANIAVMTASGQIWVSTGSCDSWDECGSIPGSLATCTPPSVPASQSSWGNLKDQYKNGD